MLLEKTGLHAKRTCAVVLCGLMLGSSALAVTSVPTTAFADEKVDSLQSQLDDATAKLDDLQAALDQAQADLGKTQYDLDQTQQKISEVEAQIEQNKADLAAAQDKLSNQVATSYKSGDDANLVSILLNSQDFDSLVTNVFYANKVADAEAEAVQEVQDLQAQLESNQAELKAQEAQQQELLASKQQEVDAADKAASDMSNYVNQLSDEVKQAMEEERQRLAEESRKQAEAAAAAAAAQEQQQGADAGSGGSDAGSSNAGSSGGGSASTNGGPSNGGSHNSGGSPSGGTSSGGSSSASGSQRQTAINAALSQVGKPYGHANNGSNWDCNGLTNYAWGQAGVSIPYASGHYSYGQFQWMKNSGRWVSSVSALKPGDLVFYSNDGGRTCYHVALYIGNGMVVHAESYAAGVCVRSVNWCNGFCGGGSPI